MSSIYGHTSFEFMMKILVCACVLSHFFVTLWTVACQAPLSMGFSRQEYWSGLSRPPLGDLANPGIEPCLLLLMYWLAGSLPLMPHRKITYLCSRELIWRSMPYHSFLSYAFIVVFMHRFFLFVNVNTQIACMCAKSLQLCPTLCDPTDCSLPGSSVHGFSRQEYWSGLPCPPPGNLPDSRIKPESPEAPALQVDSLPWSHEGSSVHRLCYSKWRG